MELCSDTGNKAACYHMARYFEKKGDYKQAIAFFQQASAISNAMRLCRVRHIFPPRTSFIRSISTNGNLFRIIIWMNIWQR